MSDHADDGVKPCRVRWCVAQAAPDGEYCAVHRLMSAGYLNIIKDSDVAPDAPPKLR